MGLKVTNDLSVLNGKTLVGYNFNYGNEAVVVVQDKDDKIQRIRIPAAVRDLLWDFNTIAKETGNVSYV